MLLTKQISLSHCPSKWPILKVPTGCLFTFSLGTLMAGHTIRIHLELYPIKAGPHQLQVLISSSEVKEIKGYKDIFIAAAPAS